LSFVLAGFVFVNSSEPTNRDLASKPIVNFIEA
jgi:hypothetical protein